MQPPYSMVLEVSEVFWHLLQTSDAMEMMILSNMRERVLASMREWASLRVRANEERANAKEFRRAWASARECQRVLMNAR